MGNRVKIEKTESSSLWFRRAIQSILVLLSLFDSCLGQEHVVSTAAELTAQMQALSTAVSDIRFNLERKADSDNIAERWIAFDETTAARAKKIEQDLAAFRRSFIDKTTSMEHQILSMSEEIKEMKSVTQKMLDDLAYIGKILNEQDKAVTSLEESNITINNSLNGIFTQLSSAFSELQKQIGKIDKRLENLEEGGSTLKSFVDRFWVLTAAALVMFMQAGFLCLEVGLARWNHSSGIAMKNMLDWLVVTVGFYVLGYAIAFSGSWHQLPSTELYLPTPKEIDHFEFLLFQTGFAVTCATIVSGAMSERTALLPYLLIAFFCGVLVYSIVVHIAWSDAGLLRAWGFRDFAGSTVVHSTGAWIALVGVILVGPRRGRFVEEPDKLSRWWRRKQIAREMRPASLPFAMLGTMILFFGWWGFNGGSLLTFNNSVSQIILNTILAAAGGGICAIILSGMTDGRPNQQKEGILPYPVQQKIFCKTIGGVISGLVAITAGCNVVSPLSAIIIGSAAGVLHNLAYDMLRTRIDDVVAAIPVHGVAGVWGTIAVGIFGDLNHRVCLPEIAICDDGARTNYFIEGVTRSYQLGVQTVGAMMVFALVTCLSCIIMLIVRYAVGLRVDDWSEERRLILRI